MLSFNDLCQPENSSKNLKTDLRCKGSDKHSSTGLQYKGKQHGFILVLLWG